MVAVRLSPFGGMVPAVDDRLLPDINASFAKDTWVYSGTVIGMPTLKLLRANSSALVSKIYRLPNNYVDSLHLSDAIYIEFNDADTDVIRSLVVSDTFDRYYWASASVAPMYNTRARIAAGLNPFLLGVPAPGVPVLTASGGTGVLVARAYVTTFVSAYGEEGIISAPASVSSAHVDGTFVLTLPPADPLDIGTNRNLTQRRIYRTITATNGTTTYFLLATIPIATTTYSDTTNDLVLSANASLASTNWSGPPADLQGWVTMSNGMVAGWRQNEIWFCEPFRMHAWPAAYTIVVEYPIVGLGVSNQTLVVCTEGYPHTATGINPASISITKTAGLLPCTSRGGIVSTTTGVYFPAPQGLVLVAAGGVINVTKELIRKDNWIALVATNTLRAVQLGAAYYGFGAARFGVFSPAFEPTAFAQEDFSGARRGLLLDPTSHSVAFNLLSSVDPVTNVMMDAWSSEIFLIIGANTYWLDLADKAQPRQSYTWRSKIFQTARQDNFQAVKAYFAIPPGSPTLAPAQTGTNITLTSTMYGILRVYADNRLVFARELRVNGEQFRLPSGFRGEFWQFEIEGRVEILNIQIATSPTELRNV